MSRPPIALLASMLLLAASCAKGERDLFIDQDGVLRGVPDSFGRTGLYIDGLDEGSPVIAFKSGTAINALPNCVTTVIGLHEIDHVAASGSWDRYESSIPPFVRVNFFEGYRERFNYTSRIEIMFDLETAEIIDITKFVRLTTRQGERMEELIFPADCHPLAARPN